MPTFIEAGNQGDEYVNVDYIVDIRVSMYQQGVDMVGIVDMYQVEAFMAHLGWTVIKDGFKTKGKAALALTKLVVNMQSE